MKKLIIALLLGIAAGVIDVIPMIIQGLDWYANTSAFTFWIVVGVFISYIDWPMYNWLKGLIIAVISVVPIAIIVLQDNPISLIPIFIMSAILGSLIGFFSVFIENKLKVVENNG